MTEETEFDKEQRRIKIQAAKDIAGGICKKHPEIGQAGGAMIFSRHVYRIARFEINRMLEEHVDDPEVRSYVEEILVQSWSEAADQQNITASLAGTLITGLQGTVLPFVSNFQSIQRRIEQDNVKEVSEALEAERRETPVPLGFAFGATLGEYLPRDKTLCLVGRPVVLEWVNASAVETALKEPHPKFKVVHLTHWARPNLIERPEDIQARGSVTVPPLRWKGAADSQGKWGKFISTYADKLGGAVDLLVIDDIGPLYTQGLLGGRITYKANHAHKNIRRWADKEGCAVIMGLPFTEDPADEAGPDLTSPAFEQLRTFTTLRPVWTKDHEKDEGKVEVWIGKDAHHWVLSKEILS